MHDLKKHALRCLLALSMCGVGQAYAGCEISLEANPPFPETIASTQVVGTVIYQGNLTWRFSECISNTLSLDYALAAGGPLPAPVWGVSGLTVQAGNPQFANFVRTWARTGSNFNHHDVRSDFLNSSNMYLLEGMMNATSWFRISWPYPASFEVTQPITLKASATTVSGKFPDPAKGSVLQDRNSMPQRFKDSCMAGPWVFPISFSDCSSYGFGVRETIFHSWGFEPLIGLTPAVPRIVSGSASTDQNCRPVLRSSITIPNLKKP
jgi:hypothetical protein